MSYNFAMSKPQYSVTLMCSGKKCCPEATFNTDGSVDIVDKDDGKYERIHLDAEQVAMLRGLLIERA